MQSQFFSISDQAAYALVGFTAHILLAAWLEPAEYGKYVLVYAVVTLAQSFGQAFFEQPFVVLSAGRYAERQRKFEAEVIKCYVLAITSLALVTIGFVYFLAASKDDQATYVAVVLAVTPVLLMQLVRRVWYVEDRAGVAAVGTATYLVLSIFGLCVLHMVSAVSIVGAFMVNGAAACVVTVGWLTYRKRASRKSAKTPEVSTRKVMAELARYGRWAIGTQVGNWFLNGGYLLLVGAVAGREVVAILRAIINLFLPFQHLTIASANYYLPRLAGLAGTSRFHRLVALHLRIVCMAALVFVSGMYFAGVSILGVLYGSQYSAGIELLPFVALLPLVWSITAAFLCALRALERPRDTFIASGFACVLLASAIFLLGKSGRDIVLALVACHAILAIVLAGRYYVLEPCRRTKECSQRL